MNTFLWAGIFVAVLSASTVSARKVPIAKVGSKTFYMIEGKGDTWWHEALHACGEERLHLAVIENDAESHALSSAVLLHMSGEDASGLMWLGAYLKNGKWFWGEIGKELTYTNWNPDAVLNQREESPTNNLSCGFMSGGLKWGTMSCGAEKAHVVCQKNDFEDTSD